MPHVSSLNRHLKPWNNGRFGSSGPERYKAAKKLVGANPDLRDWDEYTAAEQEFREKNGFYENEPAWSVSFSDPEARCSFRIKLDLFVKPNAAKDSTHWEFGYVTSVMWYDGILERAKLSTEALLALKQVFHARGWYEVKEKAVEFWRQKGEEVLGKQGFEVEKNCYEKAVDDVKDKLDLRFTKPIPQSEMFDIYDFFFEVNGHFGEE